MRKKDRKRERKREKRERKREKEEVNKRERNILESLRLSSIAFSQVFC